MTPASRSNPVALSEPIAVALNRHRNVLLSHEYPACRELVRIGVPHFPPGRRQLRSSPLAAEPELAPDGRPEAPLPKARPGLHVHWRPPRPRHPVRAPAGEALTLGRYASTSVSNELCHVAWRRAENEQSAKQKIQGDGLIRRLHLGHAGLARPQALRQLGLREPFRRPPGAECLAEAQLQLHEGRLRRI